MKDAFPEDADVMIVDKSLVSKYKKDIGNKTCPLEGRGSHRDAMADSGVTQSRLEQGRTFQIDIDGGDPTVRRQLFESGKKPKTFTSDTKAASDSGRL